VYVLAQAYRKKGQKAEADEMLAKIASFIPTITTWT